MAYAPSRGDRIELDMIPAEDGFFRGFYAFGPPDSFVVAVGVNAYDRVLADGASIEIATDDREVV